MASKSDKELIFMPNGATAAPGEGEEFLPALDEMTLREEKLHEVAGRAEPAAEERVPDLLLPPPPPPPPGTPDSEAASQREMNQRSREKFRAQLREGKLDERMVDLEVRERQMPSFE